MHGVHLTRTDENLDEIAAAFDKFGAPVGLTGLLGDLNRQARAAKPAGRLVTGGFAWEDRDVHDARWWPQGITTSADAEAEGVIEGRRLLVTSWYAKGIGGIHDGSRITVVDLDTLRYRHVLLVEPSVGLGGAELRPLKVHAGGLVWLDHFLHIAGTRRGLFTANFDDIIRIREGSGAEAELHGYGYALPVRYAYTAATDDGHEQLRYSFLSLDRGGEQPTLIAGEYGRKEMSTRLARYAIDPGTHQLAADEHRISRPLEVHPDGVGHMQGCAVVGGTYYVTSSRGRWRLGSLYVGTPGRWKRHRWALPPGPEDISYWPETDSFWSLSEWPGRRHVFEVRRSALS